jgi:hypothetical protein
MTTNEVVKFSENLPRAQAGEQTFRDASALIERWQRGHSEAGGRGLSHYEHLIAVIDEITPASDKLCAKLRKLSKPATKIEIANHLALLLKSFPNAGKDNAEVFGRMLCEDIGAQQPTIGGLEAACRHLRRTNRFIPVIAEVLTALAEAEASQRQIIRTLSSFPEHRQKLLARIADSKARQEECERENREFKQRKALTIAHQNDPDIDLPF